MLNDAMPTENSYRSVVKGVTWRIVALSDTVLLSFIFTGNVVQALTIAAGELVTKIFLYYVHERGWLRLVHWHDRRTESAKSLREKHIYGFGKALTWRVIGSLDTILWAFIVTGSVGTSLSIGGMEFLTKTVLFYVHERTWLKFKWGLHKKPEETRLPSYLARGILD
jgi:uncharacterized membrane protein